MTDNQCGMAVWRAFVILLRSKQHVSTALSLLSGDI